MKTESNTKQSSVDWIIGEIIKHQMTFYGTSSIPLHIIEQGKVMHKEEMIEFAWDCHLKREMFKYQIEEKYNETFTNERV